MEPRILLKIYAAGVLFLLGAIFINIIAKALKIPGWYEFINQIREKGISSALAVQNFLSITFLLVIYPLLLGIVAFFIFKYLF